MYASDSLGGQTLQGLGGRGFDVFRCLRLLAFGVTMDGPVGHMWYTFLDQNIMPKEPTSNKAVVLKMLADQLLWAPFFSCIFFAFTNTLAVRLSLLSSQSHLFLERTLVEQIVDMHVLMPGTSGSNYPCHSEQIVPYDAGQLCCLAYRASDQLQIHPLSAAHLVHQLYSGMPSFLNKCRSAK